MLKPLVIGSDQNPGDMVQAALSAIRRHLGMEVAYVSEFVGDRAVFRYVDAPGFENLIKAGDSMLLDDVYCRRVMQGELPQLMTNAADFEIARRLPITTSVPIGAHMSVPIIGSDGSALGMFCCLSRRPDTSLTARDLQTLGLFAEVAGRQVAEEIETERRTDTLVKTVTRIIDETAFRFAFQPIWDFAVDRPVGFEALCRFEREPIRSPDKWFADAASVGLGTELELAAIELALKALPAMPSDLYLSVNASPQTLTSPRLSALLAGVQMNRVVLEVTEHAPVADYTALAGALAPLRQAGVGLAIDDAGAGYSSLQHILRLAPDRIKLDASLARSIDADPGRRALTAALVFFARETGSMLIAEGIETEAEFETLRALGVHKGQGYFLGRPSPLAEALASIAERQQYFATLTVA